MRQRYLKKGVVTGGTGRGLRIDVYSERRMTYIEKVKNERARERKNVIEKERGARVSKNDIIAR